MRHRLHILLSILLWMVFAYYWSIVVQRPINEHTQLALTAVGSIVGLITLFSAFWIAHNVRIARRHDRRKVRRSGLATPESDYLGRTLVYRGDDQLLDAAYVEVYVVEVTDETRQREHKVFHIPDTIPGANHG